MYRKNTASQYIYFVLVDASTGAALTGATVTAYRALDGGSQASATGTTTELANGQYRFNLSQADTNADYGSYLFTATSAVPVEKTVVFTGANVTQVALGANTTTPPTAGAIADQVWDEAYADHNAAGSFGKLLNTIRKANLTIDGTVSSAITPTTLTFSSNVSATTSAYAHAVLLFVSGPLTGENSPIVSYNNTNGVFVLEEPLTAAPSDGDEFVVIAGSHVHAIADIQNGLATTTQLTTVEGKIDAIDDYVDTEVAAIKAKTDNLPSDPADASDITAAFTEIKGAGWSSSTDTLEKIRDASGATTVNVAPYSATIPQRVIGTRIDMFFKEAVAVTIAVFNSSNVAVDLTTQGNLRVCIERRDGTDLQTIENANITISGGSNNQATWTCDATATGTLGSHYWSLRRVVNNEVLAHGEWRVSSAAFDN